MKKKQTSIQSRLHRIGGQVKRLEAAIENKEDCEVVIIQMLAIKGAVAAVCTTYVGDIMKNCIDQKQPQEMKRIIKYLTKVL